MLIEIWSDVVCPWCYIGKRRLEAALAGFPHRDQVDVLYRSFELDPTAPQVGTESLRDVIGRKYKAAPEQVEVMMGQVAQVAAEEGLAFDYDHVTHTKTVDAHRLLHLARAEGGTPLQRELKEALLAAYFLTGRSMGDHAVLAEVAVSVGLDVSRVQQVLDSDAYADGVAADLDQALDFGIAGVPFFVFDRRLAVSGAQPVEVFAQALRQAWDAGHPALEVLADGRVCGPDGCAV